MDSNLLSEQHKNFDVVMACRAGSHLYGTNVLESDIDYRGVFVPSKPYFFGCHQHIEQIETKTPDVVLFDIRKFFKLCLECNPNIIELLFVPKEKMVVCGTAWDEISDAAHLFVSKKARFTFAGYAISQLKRINTHRKYLLSPPEKQPKRSDFGLPDEKCLITQEESNAITEMIVGGKTWEMDATTMQLFEREKRYGNAAREWAQYENWKKTRNPARSVLEAKYGYDTKHGSHLYRLITEGEELLKTGRITLPRPDAALLREIRAGRYTYEELLFEDEV